MLIKLLVVLPVAFVVAQNDPPKSEDLGGDYYTGEGYDSGFLGDGYDYNWPRCGYGTLELPDDFQPYPEGFQPYANDNERRKQ